MRLRPILMTSFAFILGVLPLVVATGAGAEMRKALGTAVFSGMIGVTFFGLFLTPVFFYVIDRFASAPVWGTPALAWINRVSIDLLSLRPLRRLLSSPLAPVLRGEGPGVRGSATGRATAPLTPNPSPPEYRERGEKDGKRAP